MLKKKNKKTRPNELKALLEEGCLFEGKLSFSGTIRLNGHFKGEIEDGDTLVVGQNADIQGSVSVGEAIIAGNFNGKLIAKKRVEITSTGKLNGELYSPLLVTHEGAQMKGKIDAWRDEEPKPASVATEDAVTVDELKAPAN